jgi:hypothetical protein
MIPAIVSPKREPIVITSVLGLLGVFEFDAPVPGNTELFGRDEPDDGEETT